MRASHLFVGFITLGVFACSSSKGTHIIIDANVPDSPPDAFVCSQKGTLNGTSALDFKNTATTPIPASIPSGGTEVTVEAIVTFSDAPTTGFIIFLADNAGVFSATEAKKFETAPSPTLAMAFPIDTDANFGFGIDFVDGVVDNGDGTVSIMPEQVQVLGAETPGTVKIDAWTPAAVVNGKTTIGATFTNGTYDGFNVLADGSLDQAGNGCTILLQNLQFINMTVLWPATFPASIAAHTAQKPNFGSRKITATHMTMDRN